MANYTEINNTLASLVNGVPHRIANLANSASLLFNSLEDINWAGFYILNGDTLVLGPFQGKPACIEIPVGKGVCGTAVARSETVVVEDVHLFPGHIACDASSRSEIVIPLFKDGRVWGVLDIDSPSFSRFKDEDRQGLEKFSSVISKLLST